MEEAAELFARLQGSSVYVSEHMQEKRAILEDLIASGKWDELQQDFNEFGIRKGRFGNTEYGIGYLFEALVQFSSAIIPEMSLVERKLSEKLLAALRGGSSPLVRTHIRHNPDFLVLSYDEDSVVFRGMVEAKLSPISIRPEQLKGQEAALHELVTSIHEDMQLCLEHQIFTGRDVVLSPSFQKTLVFPSGVDLTSADKYVSDGWRICISEFTYNEVKFLGSLLWSKYQPKFLRVAKKEEVCDVQTKRAQKKTKTQTKSLRKKKTNLETRFLDLFTDWGELLVRSMIEGRELHRKEVERIFFFIALGNQDITSEEDVEIALQYGPTLAELVAKSATIQSVDAKHLREDEKELCEVLLETFAPSEEYALIFVSLARAFQDNKLKAHNVKTHQGDFAQVLRVM